MSKTVGINFTDWAWSKRDAMESGQAKRDWERQCNNALAVLHNWPLLDAPVYRSCPECGGSRVLATGPPLNIGEPCPACADAPTAIVSAALREKAKVAMDSAARLSDVEPYDIAGGTLDEMLDAVLSTVLGHVRYAKEIGRWHDYYPGHIETGNAGRQTRDFVSLRSGDTIAILEEAGKEGEN